MFQAAHPDLTLQLLADRHANLQRTAQRARLAREARADRRHRRRLRPTTQ